MRDQVKPSQVGEKADWKPPNRAYVLFTQALTCPGATWVGWQLNFLWDASHVWFNHSLPPFPKLSASSSSLSPNLRCLGWLNVSRHVPRSHRSPVKAYTEMDWMPRPLGISPDPCHSKQQTLDTDEWTDRWHGMPSQPFWFRSALKGSP